MQLTIQNYYDYYKAHKKGDIWDISTFSQAFPVFINQLMGDSMSGMSGIPYTVNNKAVFFDINLIQQKVAAWVGQQ